jgi:hypothetical protein
MLIAMDVSVVDVQHRLGHRKPDMTLRIYAHEWKYRAAARSRIGSELDRLFHSGRAELLAPAEAREAPLALPFAHP